MWAVLAGKFLCFNKKFFLAPFAVAVIVTGGLLGYRYFAPVKPIESIAIMPYRSHGLLEIDKPDRCNDFCGNIAVSLTKNRIERVLREDVLDVRDE